MAGWLWLAIVLLVRVVEPGTPTATCGEPSGAPVASAALRPADVVLAIDSPRAGETVSASDGKLTVNVEYWGPRLVAPEPGLAVDEYHLTYFLDSDPTPYIGTLTPMPRCDARIVASASPQVTFPNVSSGSHSLAVVLAGSNRVSVNPPVATRVTFMVK
jgi:hypothetical protein